MYDIHIPAIDENSKLIIGLGDSFTQGVGSWSKETYLRYNNFIDPLNVPRRLEFEMYEYSWVSQICKNHLSNFTPVNFESVHGVYQGCPMHACAQQRCSVSACGRPHFSCS